MKELEITKTKIGEKIGSYKGRYTVFSVYYGNYVTPSIDNEFVHLKESEYEELLNSFLSSEEGSVYKSPSREEIIKASKAVINSEIVYLKEKNSEKLPLEIKDFLTENEEEEEIQRKKIRAERRKQSILLALAAVCVVLETVLSIIFLL